MTSGYGGFMKALVDNNDQLLRFTVIGPKAAEMAFMQMAMAVGPHQFCSKRR